MGGEFACCDVEAHDVVLGVRAGCASVWDGDAELGACEPTHDLVSIELAYSGGLVLFLLRRLVVISSIGSIDPAIKQLDESIVRRASGLGDGEERLAVRRP